MEELRWARPRSYLGCRRGGRRFARPPAGWEGGVPFSGGGCGGGEVVDRFSRGGWRSFDGRGRVRTWRRRRGGRRFARPPAGWDGGVPFSGGGCGGGEVVDRFSRGGWRSFDGRGRVRTCGVGEEAVASLGRRPGGMVGFPSPVADVGVVRWLTESRSVDGGASMGAAAFAPGCRRGGRRFARPAARWRGTFVANRRAPRGQRTSSGWLVRCPPRPRRVDEVGIASLGREAGRGEGLSRSKGRLAALGRGSGAAGSGSLLHCPMSWGVAGGGRSARRCHGRPWCVPEGAVASLGRFGGAPDRLSRAAVRLADGLQPVGVESGISFLPARTPAARTPGR